MATFIFARLTFTEAIRRRILSAAFVLGVAFLALYGTGFFFMQEQWRSGSTGLVSEVLRKQFYTFLVIAGLYAVNFLGAVMGAILSADTLAGEIASGTVQALATKPVRRVEIVLGKWLGFAGLLGLYLLLMAGGVVAVAYGLTGFFLPNVAIGIGLIYGAALLVMTITLACSSRFSALATGGVVFGLYGIGFIGGWVEQFGAFLQNQTAVNVGIISSLIIPSEALWRRAAFEMTPPLGQALGFASGGPFITTSVPSPLMIAYAGLYMVVVVALTVRQFSRRDL
jgi:ABC-type transport system involved in multi-copper enzyme maturation permease subunit